MYLRIRKPMLLLYAIGWSNLKAMDQRWVSYSRRDSQLRWSTVWKKYCWEQRWKIHSHLLYQTAVLTFKLHSILQYTLEVNRTYELAMVNLETYYSSEKIWEGDNNSFKWSVDDGQLSTCLQNAEIIRICGNSDITILPNVNTLKCILNVVGAVLS